ncbi:hypothetical protein [Streptomyces sp. NPDC021139]|uniref:tetratricopeptide repeat protein n=1 Tax=unclassified Streptomyces TaxID=2593676 RepID=UPI0033F4C2D8
MVPAADSNRVEGSAIGRDSFQVGQIHGPVTVYAGGADRRAAPEVPLLRVRDADPLRLGVHRPIRVPGTDTPALPAYVPRDLDTRDGDGLRPLIAAAAEHGGFVLLVGGSSVGKTRSLYEAIRDAVPDWGLVQPMDAGELQRPAARRKVVVWLDELQNHLADDRGLTAATVRALLAPEVLIVGTLWPHYYDAWSVPHTSKEEDDRHCVERDLLKLADVVHVGSSFSAAERERAAVRSLTDERLRVALTSEDFGLTQVIAGAPQLVHRWEHAGPYERALMTAAVDATLLGAQSPIPESLLRSAVPGYCGPAERAGAPGDWFEAALAYAAQPLLGATATLVPVSAGRVMGRPDGYRVADYLVQHTGRVRGAMPPPETFWEACAEHLTDTADLSRIGNAAAARLRYTAAVPLLRKAVEAGSASAMHDLGELYRRMGDEEAAQEMADRLSASDDPQADLYQVLLAGWDFEEIADLAEAGNEYAVSHIIEYGDPRWAMQVLLDRMEPDDLGAWRRMAELLRDEGQEERAADILDMIFRRDDEPDDDLLMCYAESLKHTGREERLRELTAEGYFWPAHYLADLLYERDEKDEALDVLRELAGQGHMDLDDLLATFLAEGGHLDELLARAEDGDCRSAVKAAWMLHERGRTEQAVAVLIPYADDGEVYAASCLARLQQLTESVDDLRARAADGDEHAADAVVRHLLAEGRCEEAVTAATAYGRLSWRHREILECLERHGAVDLAVSMLEALERSGDAHCTYGLAKLLRKHRREDALRACVDRGDPGADRELRQLLREQGRSAEADALLRHGLTADGRTVGQVPG